MDKSAIEHISESTYSHPISNDTVEIRLKTKLGDDIKKVELLYTVYLCKKYLITLNI